MSNLLPEVRVNKNGVPVVKHVRSEVTTTAPRKGALPAPSLPTYTAKESLLMSRRSEIAYGLRVELAKKKYRLSDKARVRMFETLHDDTLDVLDSLAFNSDAATHSINMLMGRCLGNRNFADLNNVMTVADLINSDGESAYRNFDALVGGFQMNRPEGAPLIDWSHQDKSEWAKPQALYKAANDLEFKLYVRHFSDDGGMTKFLKSPNLTALILERPHDVDRIISLLNERKLKAHTDEQVADLQGLLDQKPESAISEGVL